MYLHSRQLTVEQLHNFLAAQEGTASDKTFVVLERSDMRIDWCDLERHKSAPNGSVNVGQMWDFRRAVNGGSALHVHVFADCVTIHLDVHDPASRPVAHLLAETYAVRGAAVGGGAAWLFGAAAGPALVLVGLGALLGGTSPVAARYLSLARIDWDGTAFFEVLPRDRARTIFPQGPSPRRQLRGR